MPVRKCISRRITTGTKHPLTTGVISEEHIRGKGSSVSYDLTTFDAVPPFIFRYVKAMQKRGEKNVEVLAGWVRLATGRIIAPNVIEEILRTETQRF